MSYTRAAPSELLMCDISLYHVAKLINNLQFQNVFQINTPRGRLFLFDKSHNRIAYGRYSAVFVKQHYNRIRATQHAHLVVFMLGNFCHSSYTHK